MRRASDGDRGSGSRLPLAARAVLRLLEPGLDGEAREVIEGDLEELLAERLDRLPRWRSQLWISLQALQSVLAVRRERANAASRDTSFFQGSPLADWTEDLRQGLRMLWRRPVFSLVVVLLLGLGVGASTTMWTVLRSSVLAPLPYPQPERLGLLRISAEGVERAASLSAPELRDFREQAGHLEDIAAQWTGWTVLRPDSGEAASAERLRVGWVTANLFPLYGVTPLLGRGFTEAEEDPNGPSDKVLLSHHLWVRRFGADPEVVGRALQLEDGSRTVVGVMPRGFRSMLDVKSTNDIGPDLWIPNTYWVGRDVHWLRAVARRRADSTWEQARDEVDSITRQLNDEHAEYAESPVVFHLDPLHAELSAEVRPALAALGGMTLLLLLIATANAAALFLTRSQRRANEFATRSALGGSVAQLIRGLVGEALPLGLLGFVVALLGAHSGQALLIALRPTHLPRLEELSLGPSSILFALSFSVGVVLLASLLPAAPGLASGLRRGFRAPSRLTEGRSPAQAALLVGQVAVAMVLLAGAGLLVASLQSSRSVDLGYRTEGVTAMRLNVPTDSYRSVEERVTFLGQLESALALQPAVEAVGTVNILPLADSLLTGRFRTSTTSGEADYRFVTTGYLPALGASLKEGRNLTRQDVEAGRRVVILDERIASSLWPDSSAVGRSLEVGLGEGSVLEPHEVVGVLSHLHYESVRDPGRPQVHMPYSGQTPVYLALQSSLSVVAATDLVRTVAGDLDPELPVEAVRSLDSYVDANLADLEFATTVLVAFAAIALGLMLAGTYGVLSFWVKQRAPAVGLRMALGATPEQVIGQVLGRGLGLAALGVALGLVGVTFFTRLLDGLLFGVGRLDPAVLSTAAAALLGTVALAALSPARRASRVSPARTLRSD